jgi:histidinol-phosphate/aromatic aminotransferase/cobyric acid decarboxylase-like protein/choline kinase
MQAIILAAGMGRRLGELTSENTKCMVPVNGTRLIDRTLSQLAKLNLKRIILVVGYKRDNLVNYLGDHYDGIPLEYIINPIYDKTNNIYSLFLAKDKLQEDDTLLLESDIILDDRILNLLVDAPFPNVALVSEYESWMDGTMVTLDNEHNILNFIPKKAFKYSDTSHYYKTLNIYKFSRVFSETKYVPFLHAYSKVVGNNEYYENVLRIITFLDCHDLKAIPVADAKWYEIDDKQDLDIAEALFADEKDLLRKYYGRFGGFWRFPKMLDFCYLVNPFFQDSGIMDELEANFRTLVSEYPSGMKVNTLIASKCWGVKEEYIVPGNGAAELIKVIMNLLPGKLGVIRPTFEEYPNRREKDSLVPFFPDNEEFRYTAADLIRHFSSNKVDSLVLINPDNPSGNFISFKDVLELAGWCEKNSIYLVVDESFVDFSENRKNSSLINNDILAQHSHLVVIKSISKSYGVPGLRLGILCSSDTELISRIKSEVSIWNINSFAEFFMQIFSKYENEYERACDRFIEERKDFENKLHSVSFLRVMPSQANYFLCEVLPPLSANQLVITMLKRFNILIRDCSSKIGLDGKQYIRIAVRSHKDNTRLIEAFKLLANNKL